MKNASLLFFLALLTSCANLKQNEHQYSTIVEVDCPTDGKCEIELIKNKSIKIKADDIGSLYYELEESDKSDVYHFQYKKVTDKQLQDGHYIEEVIFEIDKKNKELVLTDGDLKKTNMLFGRHCYCKGQAGFFRLENGRLQLSKSKTQSEIKLDYKTDKVPHLISSIKIISKKKPTN